jgi:putative membrane protein
MEVALRYSVPALLLSAALSLNAYAADMVSSADRTFIAKVSQGGMFEVAAGEAGAAQGSSQDIRDQGATEAHDHTLVGAKLKTIATGAGVTFPDTLNAAFQHELDRLKAMSGRAFDAAYLQDMKVIHAKDGAAFAIEAQSGSDPKLRAFAAETHRIVLRHIGELDAVGP